MCKAGLIASALFLLTASAHADGFNVDRLYAKVKSFTESLLAPSPQPRGHATVPAPEIDPRMALVPHEEGRMRIIAPPGTPGGDHRVDPR